MINTIKNDREYFHQPENFSNALEFLVTKSILSIPKESLIIKSIIGHKGSVAPCALCPNGCHVSRVRQVPSLTPSNTLRPNGRHVSMGHQVPRGCQGPRGRQVPSLTPGDTLRSDGRHVSMGC